MTANSGVGIRNPSVGGDSVGAAQESINSKINVLIIGARESAFDLVAVATNVSGVSIPINGRIHKYRRNYEAG